MAIRSFLVCRGLLGSTLRGFPAVSSVRRTSTVTPYSNDTVGVSVRHGFPVLSVPLPSKRDTCDFVLRPYLQNVGDFMAHLRTEDPGIDSVSILGVDGNRISKATGLDLLLQSNFDLRINDVKYRVEVPEVCKFPLDGEQTMSDIRNMIHKLYSSLNIGQHQLTQELELRGELEELRSELAPLEAQRGSLTQRAQKRTNAVIWGGMAFMSLQFGFFARLTWWEYSWDIMEPVTYFVTYGTSMAMFAYFVLTKQDYVYPDAASRQYLSFFHRMANRHKFDVDKYNHLKDAISHVEDELERLHDPLHLNLPMPSPTAHTANQEK